jgi:NapC/NirT cytochrome c family, N-terminal region/Cytochrome c3
MQKLRSVWQNPWTTAGLILSVLAILFFVSFQLIELGSPTNNPYVGLWTFMVLPAILILGLILMPLGWLLERRRRRKLFPDVKEWPRYPKLDLNNPHNRKIFYFFGVGSLIVIPLIGVSSYEGYHYTDSTQFCGQVCHSVMNPEYTAYSNSPHARVPCADCHIGPGASWYVRSKISGIRQVFAVTFHTYSRPIPTPIENLRPARETCEQCHWPERFFGSQLITRVHFAPDADNTRRELNILVKTGGADSSMGRASGIHWHMALSNKIEYIATDTTRQTIPWVRSTHSSGVASIFRSDGKTAADPPPAGELRRIDCMDCHNRPTHIIQSPDRAVNIALESGRIDRGLPYIKKISVEAMVEPYSTAAEADAKIASHIQDFYRTADSKMSQTRQVSINRAIDEVRAIYHRNFFPEMKVNWRAYPDNIGHLIFDGCYRCHDNKHVSDDKRVIRKDCTVCHEFQQPVSDGTAPNTFRLTTPEHPYQLLGLHADLKCSACHMGGPAPVPSCAGCHTAQSLFRQGKNPSLPGLTGTPPAMMAELDCDSCHDLSKPQTRENLTAQCETCHSKGYGQMLQMWIDDAKSERVKANAAIDDLRQSMAAVKIGSGARSDLETLAAQMQSALEQVDKAGPHHNPDFADAIYAQIVKLASEGKARSQLGGITQQQSR